MSYQQARRIKHTGLKDLIAQNIVAGQGVGSAIGTSLSQSFKAKVTGIKESFDPLNIAKKLTGNIGAAVLGRMTGRSQQDISYFAGGKKGNSAAGITQDTNMENIGRALYTNVSEGQRQRMRKGDSATNVLAKLYNLMKKNYEAEENRRELDINFKYKEENLKEKRHAELMEAITGKKYTSTKTAKPEKESGGLFDSLIEKIKEFFGPVLEYVEMLKKFFSEKTLQLLSRIMSFFEGGALGAALLGIAGLAALGLLLNKLSKGLEEKAEDLGGTGALESESEEQTSYATGAADGDMAVLQAVQAQNENKESPADRRVRLIKEFQTDVQDYLKPKGFNKVKEDKDGRFYFEDSDGNPPPPELLKEARVYAQNEQDKRKVTGEKKKIQNISTGTLIRGEESDARGGQGTSLYASVDPRRTDMSPSPSDTGGGAAMVSPKGIPSTSSLQETPTATMAPPAPNPVGEQVQKSISQNNDLLIKEPEPRIITIDNSKSVNMSGGNKGSGLIRDGSVDVRIDDPTLQKTQRQSFRPV